MKAPSVSSYMERLGHVEYRRVGCVFSYDEESYEIIDEIFGILKKIKPNFGEDGRELWLQADRGSIEDFGDYKEAIECGEVNSFEDFKDWWLAEFPEETVWYCFGAVEDPKSGYKAMFMRHRQIIEVDPEKERGYENDISEFMRWLRDAVKNCYEQIKDGTYNDYIAANLPPQHRVGTVVRKEYWDVFPEEREEFRKDITDEEVSEFIAAVSKQTGPFEYQSVGRMDSFTANEFFTCCALGYAANGYKGTKLSPRDQYYRNADGRDEDLREIDPDSPEAFETWLTRKDRYGGHPWEVCRGGNSTHIDCIVHKDEGGYFLIISGSSLWRTVETVKFYLAVLRAGYPVFILDAGILVERFRETELVGIVPEGVIPCYCSSWFPDGGVASYMNLPEEKREELLPHCVWQPLDRVELLEGE